MTACAEYSLWLLPSQQTLLELRDVVDRLAPRFATRAFIPHVTVQGDIERRLHQVVAMADQLSTALPQQDVRVRGIEHTAHYYRTFYVAFDAFDDFATLRRRATEIVGSDEGASPFPHLSLAYGAMAPDAKTRLASDIAAVIPATIRFDRIAIALAGKRVDIASWRILQTFALAETSLGAHSSRTTAP